MIAAGGGPSLVGWSALVAAVFAGVTSVWSLIQASHAAQSRTATEDNKTKIDEVNAAFAIWQQTVTRLEVEREHDRTEIAMLRQEVDSCHRERDAQAAEIAQTRAELAAIRARMELG